MATAFITLADYADDDLLHETKYAETQGESVRTAQRRRALGLGPPFIKIGRHIYYRVGAVREDLRAREQHQPRATRAA